MKRHEDLACARAQWRDREAYCLSNGLVQLVSLTGGGHLAEFRFTDKSGQSILNPLWVPPWKSIEPYQYRDKQHATQYGPQAEGKLLCSVAGHSLCLDYFGPPSEAEAAQGMPIHGEAPNLRWRKERAEVSARQTTLTLGVRLPVARLRFRREIRLRRGESVAYIRETVINEQKQDHFFHWTQHVTLGPPFLVPEASRVTIPATKGVTHPEGYGGRELLASGQDFRWPLAPKARGGKVDLRQPFTRHGLGFLVGVLLDPRRNQEFIAAVNEEHHLLVGYCFLRQDFPWVAIWEENDSREHNPWRAKTQARGLEFGSTPLPMTRREAFAVAPRFGTPTFSTVAAGGRRTADYVAFLSSLPPDFGEVQDIKLAKGAILVQGSGRKPPVRVAATGLGPALLEGSKVQE
jgi:hypothetical protein